jgi:hypothetical protein
LAFHTTNRHVDVGAVVVASARARGLDVRAATWPHGSVGTGVGPEHAATQWIFVAEASTLAALDVGPLVPAIGPPPAPLDEPWTDAASSVLDALRGRGRRDMRRP